VIEDQTVDGLSWPEIPHHTPYNRGSAQ